MARTRTLNDMANDALKLADLENATQRFPITEVYEYCNKGLAHVYAKMLVVQDRPFYINEVFITCTPPIPLTAVATYSLPSDFLQILSVGWAPTIVQPGGPWIPLEPLEEADFIRMTNAGFYGGFTPLKYCIGASPSAYTQGTIPTAYSISILPTPTNNSMIRFRYIPTCPRLINASDSFDGLLGFEDAAVTWAAILMRRKDDLDTADLERDMAMHYTRIDTIAKRRDRSRPPRTSIVRTQYSYNTRGNRWGGGSWGGV